MAHLHEFPEQFYGRGELVVVHPQICEFQQRFGKFGFCFQRLLQQLFSPRIISLPLFDVAEIEQAGRVVRIPLETLVKIFWASSNRPRCR